MVVPITTGAVVTCEEDQVDRNPSDTINIFVEIYHLYYKFKCLHQASSERHSNEKKFYIIYFKSGVNKIEGINLLIAEDFQNW